jgi:sec-independent protein translocase protein TatC
MDDLRTQIKKFLPYLEDIQRRFYSSTVIVIIFFVTGVLSSGFVIRQFITHFKLSDVVLATTSPFQLAEVAFDIGFFFALVAAVPLFIYHLLSFTHSALNKSELRKVLFGIPVALFLFVTGFVYGFFILFYSFTLLASVNVNIGVQNIWDISLFLSQIIITSTLLGLIFQFPLVISLLLRIGIITKQQLKQQRRLIILALFILTSLLPPTDGLSLIAMALPLYLLYEATILINYKA